VRRGSPESGDGIEAGIGTPNPDRSRRALIVWTIIILLLGAGSLAAPQLKTGLTWAWKRWRLQRAWAGKRVSVEFESAPVWDVIRLIVWSTDADAVVVHDASCEPFGPVTYSGTNVTIRELADGALEGSGFEYRVLGADTVVIYARGSRSYRQFQAGGLRWGPQSDEVRRIMRRDTCLDLCVNPAGDVMSYMRALTEVGGTADWTGADPGRELTLKLSNVPLDQAWDMVLRASGLVGEVRENRINLRSVSGEFENGMPAAYDGPGGMSAGG
jgi:hypothetical protein